MSATKANTIWARAFVDEMGRHGVRDVVVPGSRSTPLVMAFARDAHFRMRVHLDERSAAFFALGVGKASGLPAVVVTTSGTAAANVLPAVVEASQSAVPLIVLTADRPHRLRDSDANQAIDQVGLYGSFTRAFFDIAPPSAQAPALLHLRGLAGRSVAAAIGPTAGPVHLNFPFDKPLEPVEPSAAFAAAHPVAAAGRSDGSPLVEISTGRRGPSDDDVATLVEALDSPRGVLVAGPSTEPTRVADAVLRLSARTGFPVLADPLSGARFGPSHDALRVSTYDIFLDDPDVAARLAPTVILRTGAAPTSAALNRWLQRHADVPQLVVDGEARFKDHLATASRYVRVDPADCLGAVAALAPASVEDGWREAWRRAEEEALEALDEQRGDVFEGEVLAAVVRDAPPGAALFVSSSMPVRDLDAFGRARLERLSVFGNRGASGIDGIVSTAFGIASQHEQATVCVLGDIAFFHDQNGLLWRREADAAVVFVLLDNDGGGIFHLLPIAEHEPHFQALFATPHGLDLRHAAALHDIDLVDATAGGVGKAVRHALAEGGTHVVRVRTERAGAHARRAEVRQKVARRVREAVGDRG